MAEEKILIADDDPAVRRLLVRVVEGSGFQAVTACDGTEAVHLASREPFALILLDIMMNGKWKRRRFSRHQTDSGVRKHHSYHGFKRKNR